MWASTSSLNLNMTRARRCAFVAAHAGCAAFAASTAFWRSAAVPRRTCACTWPWLGSNTSPWRSPLAKVEPPMKWSMLRNIKRVLVESDWVAAPLDPVVRKCQLPGAEKRETRDAQTDRHHQSGLDCRCAAAAAVARCAAAADHRTRQRSADEAYDRDARQLRHAAHAVVPD